MTASVRVHLTAASVGRIGLLRLQIHGIEYPDMIGVQINRGNWVSLNNRTVRVEEPGASYGGIGGPISTLRLDLPLPNRTVVAGDNTINFRFNGTNGVASGFRVLRFEFLAADGVVIAAEDTFVDEDPDVWQPPFPDPANVAAGERLWRSGQLKANGLPGARPIGARCSDCHAQDGRDLKYFNYSNASIIARSQFHGLSELEGTQIASYIRSLDVVHPGRPWNPPYQPGPGVNEKPVPTWAAGAGLGAILKDDIDTLPYIFGFRGSLMITPAAFDPDGNLNPLEIPIALPLPDWNHWLPHVFPADVWGARFNKSEFAQMYRNVGDKNLGPGTNASTFFASWIRARSRFLAPISDSSSKKWSPRSSEELYSAELWQLVKTWEITQQFGLEERAASGVGMRAWPNAVAAATAPAEAGIPDNANGMSGNALTDEYFNNAWYELQVVLNSGGHRHSGKYPLDWIYLAAHIQNLQKLSGRAEPGRLLVAVIKAMQSSDPNSGPENRNEGWRPESNIDPRIMVARDWLPAFTPLPSEIKREITESFLSAWLDKTLLYPPAAWFQLGMPANSYRLPENLQGVAGGRVWESAAEFLAGGVSPELVRRARDWGRQYMDLAELYHY